VAASGGGFGPGDFTGAGLGCVWFRVSGGGGSTTARTEQSAVRRGSLCLGVEGLLEHFAGDDLTDLYGEFLEVVEGSAPGRAFRTPELVDGIFRRALQRQTYLIDQ
jgi:hypothetical protein